MTGYEDVQQVGHEKSHNGKKARDGKRKPWYKHPSTIIALGAAIAAVTSAWISWTQSDIAKNQNIVAEQQELVTLVGDISQDPATIAQQSQAITNESALSNAQDGIAMTELVDSEEAATLINILHGEGVTATEYYEIALGLQSGQSYAQALSFLQRAVVLPADPRTRASSLRFEAQIDYQLGKNSAAEHADMLAGQAYAHAQDVTPENEANNLAYTELFDAYYQASLNCTNGKAEVTAANKILALHPELKAGTTPAYDNAEKELQLYRC